MIIRNQRRSAALIDCAAYIALLCVLLTALVSCARSAERPALSELLARADRLAREEDPSSVLVRINHIILYGDYSRWSYQFDYVSPAGETIIVTFFSKALDRPRSDVFDESIELTVAPFSEWQKSEPILRSITTDPEEIIQIAAVEAQKKTTQLRISTVQLVNELPSKTRGSIRTVWRVTYLSDTSADRELYVIDPTSKRIIDVRD